MASLIYDWFLLGSCRTFTSILIISGTLCATNDAKLAMLDATIFQDRVPLGLRFGV